MMDKKTLRENVQWLFFDVGSTLVSEDKPFLHRLHEIADAVNDQELISNEKENCGFYISCWSFCCFLSAYKGNCWREHCEVPGFHDSLYGI